MSTHQENRAVRERLIVCRDWIFNLYINGVKVDGIQRALVHKRDPWINRGQIEYAIKTWKREGKPQDWPLEEPQRTPGFIVPPPPPNAGHLSLPTRLYPPQPQPDLRLHRSDGPRSFMPTSTMGTGYATSAGFPMASQPQQGFYSPFYTRNSQNISDYQHPSQEASNANPPPQAVATYAEEDAEHESVCTHCDKIIGMECSCPPAFQ